MAEKEIKKIALIISGGTCRGSAQVAFINELIKKVGLERICVISASSIGAITAYSTSVGRTEQLIEAYRNLDCDSIGHFIKKPTVPASPATWASSSKKNVPGPTRVIAP